jgi:DNA mismatch repair protein MutS
LLENSIFVSLLSQPVLERLRELDLDRLTPLEALNLLAELKKEI